MADKENGGIPQGRYPPPHHPEVISVLIYETTVSHRTFFTTISLYPSSCAALVGNCNLSGDNADEVLQRHSVFKRMRGIRDTLCYHPDYPQHSLAKHDNFLTDVKWIEGFGLLEKYQMSFEMLILPRQMKR